MNGAQHRAATKVAACKLRVADAAREMIAAQAALTRAEGQLRREIKRDLDAWNTVAAVPS